MCNWCSDRSATNQIDDNDLDNSETGFVLFTRIKSVTNIYQVNDKQYQVNDKFAVLTRIQKVFGGH